MQRGTDSPFARVLDVAPLQGEQLADTAAGFKRGDDERLQVPAGMRDQPGLLARLQAATAALLARPASLTTVTRGA
jgi:hypothetical protein